MKILRLSLPKSGRCDAIDRIKLIAIIAVILLHAIPETWLYRLLAQFHIWQAVPLFMMLAGVTASFSELRRSTQSPPTPLDALDLLRRMRRIVIPFTIVWAIQVSIIAAFGSFDSQADWLSSWFRGGYGPGSYFIPVYLQHLVVFPIVSALDRKTSHANIALRVVFWLALSLAIDYACLLFSMPDWLYRVFYGRYLFAVVLGIWLVRESLPMVVFGLGLLVGVLYITAVTGLGWIPSFAYPSWIQQHAPAFFYTAAVFLVLWHAPILVQRISQPMLLLGRASYHIFLVQMLYFWRLHGPLTGLMGSRLLSLLAALVICCSLGTLFYLCEKRLERLMEKRVGNPAAH